MIREHSIDEPIPMMPVFSKRIRRPRLSIHEQNRMLGVDMGLKQACPPFGSIYGNSQHSMNALMGLQQSPNPYNCFGGQGLMGSIHNR